jgi:hypothetical protein
MVKFYWICILVFWISQVSCTSKSGYQTRAIKVSYLRPIIRDDEGHTETDTFSYKVFYYKKLVLYESSYEFDSIFNGDLIYKERRASFFVYHTDSLFGYCYRDKGMGNKEERVQVDSMKKNISLESSKLDTLGQIIPDSSLFTDKSNIRTEIYKLNKGVDSLQHCIIYLTFNKGVRGITESFSRKLDSIKQMKLVHVRFCFEKMYSQLYKMQLPAREIFLKMEELPISGQEQAFRFLRKYEAFVTKK